MMPNPARAQARAVAAPNPLLAPSTRAQHSRPPHFNDMVTSRSQCTGASAQRGRGALEWAGLWPTKVRLQREPEPGST